MTYEDLLDHCKDLKLFLTNGDTADVDEFEMVNEFTSNNANG